MKNKPKSRYNREYYNNWYQKNKEKKLNYNRMRYQENKERLKEYMKQYLQKPEIKERRRKYYKEHPELYIKPSSQIAFKKQSKCYFCNESRPKMLDVHHRDNNKSNNKPDNLVLLCPNHHREVHLGIRHIIKP